MQVGLLAFLPQFVVVLAETWKFALENVSFFGSNSPNLGPEKDKKHIGPQKVPCWAFFPTFCCIMDTHTRLSDVTCRQIGQI